MVGEKITFLFSINKCSSSSQPSSLAPTCTTMSQSLKNIDVLTSEIICKIELCLNPATAPPPLLRGHVLEAKQYPTTTKHVSRQDTPSVPKLSQNIHKHTTHMYSIRL
ncbi:uncharacterized protein LOC135129705 [Zophobas morio]|uniref:uncharacterized protein LOC135129705 n=1 Tax=Zophobas morio TaxID=2755281 RepID=UPI003083E5E1